MNEHTVKAFDEDITRLRGLIGEMGGLAEVAIEESLAALVTGDVERAKKVVKGDKKLDELEMQVERALGDFTIDDVQSLAAFIGMCMVLHITILILSHCL